MNNVNIEGLKDLNIVKGLFSSVNCLSEDNCFLVVLNRNYVAPSLDNGGTLKASSTVTGVKVGGLAGGIVGGAIANSINETTQKVIAEFNSKLDDKQKIIFSRNVYCGYLVNITNNGVGVIPLINSGQLIPKIKDLITDMNNYVFLTNEEVTKISIENLPLNFVSKKLALYFSNTGNVSTQWTLPKKHKLIPYQQENYNKLANKLK